MRYFCVLVVGSELGDCVAFVYMDEKSKEKKKNLYYQNVNGKIQIGLRQG